MALMMLGRQIHTVEPLVPETSSLEVKIAIEKLERYKSPGIDQILAEFIQAGGNTLCSDIHKLINSIWNKEECCCSGRNLSVHPFTKKVIKLIVVIIEYNCYQLLTKFYLMYLSHG